MRPLLAAVLAVITIFLCSPSCEGADWLWYYCVVSPPGKTRGAVTIREFLDRTATEKTAEGTTRAWTKGTVEGDAHNTLESVQRLVEMDCSGKKYRVLKVVRYYRDDRVVEDAAGVTTWQTFTPGSNWESLCVSLKGIDAQATP